VIHEVVEVWEDSNDVCHRHEPLFKSILVHETIEAKPIEASELAVQAHGDGRGRRDSLAHFTQRKQIRCASCARYNTWRLCACLPPCMFVSQHPN
jgi:hypothetical protein